MDNIPFDLEAEQAVLGSIMTDSNVFELVKDILNSDDFYELKHVNIFRAMEKLYEKGMTIDIVTVSTVLKRKEEVFEAIGGANYLAELVNGVPSASNVEHYSNLVKEKKVLRELIETSQRGILAVGNGADATELADEMAAKFMNLTTTGKQKAQSISSTLDDTFDRIIGIAEGTIKPGISTGIKNLDNIIGGLKKTDVLILCARPSVGKTSCALSVALNVAKEGGTVAFFSLEMGRDSLQTRLISIDSGVDLYLLNNGKRDAVVLKRSDITKVEESIARLKNCNIIIDDTASPTVQDIRRSCRRIKSKGKLSLVVIDYLQLIRTTKNGSTNDNVADISRNLKLIAKELDVPVLALSQLNRGIEGREDKTVKLADLRDSGAIEQDADLVIGINRYEKLSEQNDRVTNSSETAIRLSVIKHRNGPIGDAECIFDLNTTEVRDNPHK